MRRKSRKETHCPLSISKQFLSAGAVLDGGGKRSATPLSDQADSLASHAKTLSPLRSARAVQNHAEPAVHGGAGDGDSSGRGAASCQRWQKLPPAAA